VSISRQQAVAVLVVLLGGISACSTDVYLGDLQQPSAPAPDGGCGNVWTQPEGKFIHQSSLSVPELEGGTLQRGYWVLVPQNYDPSKAYPVIYEGAGCGGVSTTSQEFYAYQTVDMGQAIQVGLDDDPPTPTHQSQCYDDESSQSNDFTFLPILMAQIENNLCVDKSRQFIAGYSSGGFLANQFGCAFPDKLRGQASLTGGEPMTQPKCVNHPIAAFFAHDVMDLDNQLPLILSACTRTLRQNGCAVTSCATPLPEGGVELQADPSATTPYALPSSIPPGAFPTSISCVQFNGCPAQYPVVFCTTCCTYHDSQDSWFVPASWDFLNRLK
jgi:dienelactone hydrolase